MVKKRFSKNASSYFFYECQDFKVIYINHMQFREHILMKKNSYKFLSFIAIVTTMC